VECKIDSTVGKEYISEDVDPRDLWGAITGYYDKCVSAITSTFDKFDAVQKNTIPNWIDIQQFLLGFVAFLIRIAVYYWIRGLTSTESSYDTGPHNKHTGYFSSNISRLFLSQQLEIFNTKMQVTSELYNTSETYIDGVVSNLTSRTDELSRELRKLSIKVWLSEIKALQSIFYKLNLFSALEVNSEIEDIYELYFANIEQSASRDLTTKREEFMVSLENLEKDLCKIQDTLPGCSRHKASKFVSDMLHLRISSIFQSPAQNEVPGSVVTIHSHTSKMRKLATDYIMKLESYVLVFYEDMMGAISDYHPLSRQIQEIRMVTSRLRAARAAAKHLKEDFERIG